MHGSERLRRAGEILVCGEIAMRQRLREAAPEIEALLPLRSSWPRALRRKLEEIDRQLHLRGTIDETLTTSDEELLL